MKDRTIKSLDKMIKDVGEYERDEITWDRVLEDWEPGEILFVLRNAANFLRETAS